MSAVQKGLASEGIEMLFSFGSCAVSSFCTRISEVAQMNKRHFCIEELLECTGLLSHAEILQLLIDQLKFSTSG